MQVPSRRVAASTRMMGDIFVGTVHGDGDMMVAPDLKSYVSKELERQSAIDKQARKALKESGLFDLFREKKLPTPMASMCRVNS